MTRGKRCLTFRFLCFWKRPPATVAGLVLLLQSLIAQFLHADTFLISASTSPTAYALQTPAGTFPVQTAPLRPPVKLAVLLHVDSLTETQWQDVQVRLLKLHNATSGDGGFDLHIISQGALKSWKPLAAQSQLAKTLVSIDASVAARAHTRPSAANTLPLYQPVALYAEVGRYLPDPPAEWQSLLLIAPEPSLQPDELQLYASAYLSWQMRQKRLRLFYWPLLDTLVRSETNQPADIWSSVAASSCGKLFPASQDLRAFLTEWKAQTCQQLEVSGPSLPQGFFAYRGTLVASEAPQSALRLVGLWLASGVSPPSPDQYAQLLHSLEQAREALKKRDAQTVRSAMDEALRLNPLHEPTLRFAAGLYQRQRDWQSALKLLSPLLVVLPDNPELLNQIAALHFELKQWQDSGHYYVRSLRLRPEQPELLEKLMAIREALGDLEGSSNYGGAALRLTPRKAPLDARYGESLDKSGDSAAAHALQVAASVVPEDAPLRLRYALLAERAALPEIAQRFYELALEADSTLEAAHFGLAQIWANRKELSRSLDSVEKGLESNPSSARLLLLKADVLSQLDRGLESRQVLEEAFRLSPKDLKVVAQTALMRDVHGDRAGEAYEALARVLTQNDAAQPAVKSALERGLVVSLRDGERDRAVRFAQRLRELGARDIPDLGCSKQVSLTRNTVTVPGGIKALALAALMNEGVGAERFVGEYVSTMARQTRSADLKSREAYLNAVRTYFQTLSSLKELAKTNGNQAEIVLSSCDKPSLETTEKVLKLLGWRLKRSGTKTVLEVSSKESDASKQPYLAALGVDEIQMKSALEASTPFTLHFTDQQVPVIFDEKFWLERIIEKPSPPGGLLEAILENRAAAHLYSSLAQMNDEAQQHVMRVAEPKKLLGRYADLLAAYGASLSVVNGQMTLPGGNDTSSLWKQFVGSEPEDPTAFIASLLSRDEGKALAFFSLLANLPPLQQRFFTKSAGRLNSFYRVFPFTEKEDLKRHALVRRDMYFRDLARELPLDAEGHINFPGSAQIWLAAKGGSNNTSQVSKLRWAASKKALRPIEDEILLQLLDTDHKVDGLTLQAENFLGVVRLERHRTQPLDEATVLLLAQNYGRYQEMFPLFASLPDLSFQNFTLFFQACRNLESLDNRKLLNLALGEFQSLLQLAALLFENGGIGNLAAVEAITFTSEQFAKAREPFHFAQASLQSLQLLLDRLKPSQQTPAVSIASTGTSTPRFASSETSDERLLSALTGPAKWVSFRLQEKEYALDRAAQQREKMREVLRLQSATPLDALLRIHSAVSRLVQEKGEPFCSIEEIAIAILQLKEIDARAQESLSQRVRREIAFARPEVLLELATKLRTVAGKKNPEPLLKVACELLGELNSYLKNSLVAWIYAYYFSPQDLLIAQDPFFVRKHKFFEDSASLETYWPQIDQRTYPLESDTYIGGVLCQLGLMAGRIGLTQVEANSSFSGHGSAEALAQSQIAGLRSLPWARLRQKDVHTVGVRLRFARELVVAASLRSAIANDLSELTIGLIGVVRRTRLLRSLADHDAEEALRLLSSSDLYFLGERFWQKHGIQKLDNSPVAAAMQEIKKSSAQTDANYLGGLHLKTYGCLHNHLLPLSPYEDYENFSFAEIMSERLGHFLLDLAESMDRLGLPAEALAVLGEPAIRELAENSRMNDWDDWMAVIEGAAQVRIPELILAMQR